MPFGFEMVKPEDDSAKQKCVCTNCFQKLSAYTVELLIRKNSATNAETWCLWFNSGQTPDVNHVTFLSHLDVQENAVRCFMASQRIY